MARAEEMYQCQTVDCGYIYDPDRGDRRRKIPAGIPFADLPDDWRCPNCGAGKSIRHRVISADWITRSN